MVVDKETGRQVANPEPKIGQTWRSKDGGSLFKIASLGRDAIGREQAHGAAPDGTRQRGVLMSALANPRKWELVEDGTIKAG